MHFVSTRNKKHKVTASQAIIDGISTDGGLYVPEIFPIVTEQELQGLLNTSYEEKAVFILSKFLDDFSQDELKDIVKKSVIRFENNEPAPVIKLNEQQYVLELWHGPTSAFKDIALTVLPNLMSTAKKKLGIKDDILILAATSGDTGKAAIEGFKDADNTAAIAIYPYYNVSAHQKLQMQTQTGGNVGAIGITGNFDDTQKAVKKIFTDQNIINDFKKQGYLLSSANSINLGRLLPQIVYYFSAYLDLVDSGEIKFGDKINFVVPSGNFGNILAGYYAYKMGLFINKLICASNTNNVLTDFINDGIYDSDRKLIKTISPSMDILVSSNTERLIYELSGQDCELTKQRMTALGTDKVYNLTNAEIKNIHSLFFADYIDDDNTKTTIYNIFEEYGYLIDPHTAVAMSIYDSFLVSEQDETKTVIISTASPYKFAKDVLDALEEEVPETELDAIKYLSEITATEIPKNIEQAFTLPILHDKVVENDMILDGIKEFITTIKKEN